MKKGKDQVFDGVCSGISEFLGISDPIWVRLVFLLGGFFWIYVALMFLMEEPDNEDS
jgi:phage shock protein PspC (stress-responsive transcriptional regulator)